MTARKRILALLRAAEGGWVSGNRLVEAGGIRYSARIYELRHEDGFDIQRRTAPNGSPVDWYRLAAEPGQLTLLDADAA